MKVIFLIFFLFAASSLIAQQDTGGHRNIIVPVPVEELGVTTVLFCRHWLKNRLPRVASLIYFQ